MFIEVAKGQGREKEGPDATFRVHKGIYGSLAFTGRGLRKLARRGVSPQLHDRARVFAEPGTGRLALRLTPDGDHQFIRTSARRPGLQLVSRQLGEMVGRPAGYRLAEDPAFDIVLVPDPALTPRAKGPALPPAPGPAPEAP